MRPLSGLGPPCDARRAPATRSLLRWVWHHLLFLTGRSHLRVSQRVSSLQVGIVFVFPLFFLCSHYFSLLHGKSVLLHGKYLLHGWHLLSSRHIISVRLPVTGRLQLRHAASSSERCSVANGAKDKDNPDGDPGLLETEAGEAQTT